VTRERLYLETLESVLPRMQKVIIQEGHSERVLPYLPLGRREVLK
jgi:membrane protease subunit HflK